MLTDGTRISLADLTSAGVRLFPREAVTIARELILQAARGEVPGVPSAHVIRIRRNGSIYVEGPVAAGGCAVARAAQLLEALLPPKTGGPELRTPDALRLCIVRALGMLDVPPYPGLDDFADALQRFAAPDPAMAVRAIVERYETATLPPAATVALQAPPASTDATAANSTDVARRSEPMLAPFPVGPTAGMLTISDIRRARRATGLALAEIASRSRIPVALLRQLEWGYLANWPTGLHCRTQLVRYARAAGLDEQIVISTVWPMIEEVEREAHGRPAAVEPPVEALSVTRVEVPAVEVDVEALPLGLAAADLPLNGEAPRERPVVVPRSELPRTRSGSRRRRFSALAAVAAGILLLLVPQFVDRSALSPFTTFDFAAPQPAGPATDTAPVASSVADRRNHVVADAIPLAAPPKAAAAPSAPTRPLVTPAKEIRSDNVRAARATPAAGLTEVGTSASPTFASVGTAMFYHVDGERGSALLRAASGEGTTLRITRIVDDNARTYHARPSPDGTRIAFDSDRDGERGVYIANADGTTVRRVSGEGFAAVPSWSPDGRTLVFVRAEPGKANVWNLWRLELQSEEMQRLTSHRYGQMMGASWFPDGRHLAYSHELRLIVLDMHTGRERAYPSPRKGKLVRTPAVSPDGRRIIFQVLGDGAWLLDVDDSSMRKVLADPTAEEYSWSPDGRRVAYHSRRSGEWGVWMMSADH